MRKIVFATLLVVFTPILLYQGLKMYNYWKTPKFKFFDKKTGLGYVIHIHNDKPDTTWGYDIDTFPHIIWEGSTYFKQIQSGFPVDLSNYGKDSSDYISIYEEHSLNGQAIYEYINGVKANVVLTDMPKTILGRAHISITMTNDTVATGETANIHIQVLSADISHVLLGLDTLGMDKIGTILFESPTISTGLNSYTLSFMEEDKLLFERTVKVWGSE